MKFFDLTGLTALVTGGSSGIGSQIAKSLYHHGAKVLISGRNEDNLKKVSHEINAEYFISDLSETDGSQNLIEMVSKDHEKIDILVNNAGFTIDNLLWRTSKDDFNKVLQVNLVSVFELSKHFTRGMAKNKFGRVINISSVVGLTGNKGQSSYSASKAGVIGFTKTIALEFASKGITANCIAPGFIQTDMTDKISDDMTQNIMSSIPLERFGNTKDISALAVYLASRESEYITGQVINISGGMC